MKTDWEQTTLGNKFDIYQPQTLAKNDLDNGQYPVYGANGIIGYHSKYNHEEPQVLVTCRGATCGTVNLSKAYAWINGNAMVFKPKEKDIDLHFLKHFLIAGIDLSVAITGAAQPQITRQSLTQIKIKIPPISEQKRIAAILDKADEIRRKREQAIAKLEKLAQSIFVEMFGNPNAKNPKFNQQKLTDFFNFKTGKLDSNAASINGKYPFFTCSRENFWIDSYAFDEEALLLAGNNANADYSVKYYKGKFNAYQRTYVINISHNNSYVYAKACLEFMLKEFKTVSKGSSTKYLTMGIFERMQIQVPPIALQEEFAKRINQIEKLKADNTMALANHNALFASLQQQAFSGNL